MGERTRLEGDILESRCVFGVDAIAIVNDASRYRTFQGHDG
jgi:hypothetical protein